MESNKIDNLFDNKYIMNFNAALNLIKSFFTSNLPSFKLINEYNKSTGYWGIKYCYNEILVSISCDKGGLEKVIIIDGKEFPLWQFDRRMVNVETASEKNIIFTLNVIKRFFDTSI